jgi:hypothetical protein
MQKSILTGLQELFTTINPEKHRTQIDEFAQILHP